MRIETAKQLLQTLLEGENPETGEVLPEEHVLHNEDIQEALRLALGRMPGPKDRDNPLVTRSGRLNAGRVWTESDVEELRRLLAEGLTLAQIARRTDRRVRGIRRKIERIKAQEEAAARRKEIEDEDAAGTGSRWGKRWTAEEERKATALLVEEKCIEDIAESIRRSPRGVWMHMQQMGLIAEDAIDPYRPWTDKEIGELRALSLRGMSSEEIAERLKRAQSAVSARLFYMGIGKESPKVLPANVTKPVRENKEKAEKAPDKLQKAQTKKMGAVAWLRKDDATLCTLYNGGMTPEGIAAYMDRPERSVRCRLIFLGQADHTLLGISPMPPELAHQALPWYPEEIDALKRMHRAGCTVEEMAARLLRSPSIVRNRLLLMSRMQNTPE